MIKGPSKLSRKGTSIGELKRENDVMTSCQRKYRRLQRMKGQ
jgi:hypothetical protein